MATKTLAQLRTSVKLRYGDSNGVTTSDAELDEYLKEGLNKILLECPWFNGATEVSLSNQAITLGKLSVGTIRSIDQLAYVKIASSSTGTYRLLQTVPFAAFNETDAINTSVDSITGYHLQGGTFYFYPYTVVASGLYVRYLPLYNTNTSNTPFPVLTTDTLDATFPDTFDDAVVRWALYELFTKDADGEMADRAKRDFDSIVRSLTIAHNKPQLGEVIVPRQTDFYLLDQGSWFDA